MQKKQICPCHIGIQNVYWFKEQRLWILKARTVEQEEPSWSWKENYEFKKQEVDVIGDVQC